MKILTKFLAKRFARNLFLVLGVVSGIIFAIAFMQNIAAMTFAEAIDSSFAHFLEMLPMFLPLAAFMATLLTFYRLLLSSELVIIQSSGMSAYQIMRPMLLVAAAFGVFTLAVINPLSTRYNRAELSSSRIGRIDGAIWLREKKDDGAIIIRAIDMDYSDKDGLVFKNASLFRQNVSHQIIKRVNADNLIMEDGRLFARNARLIDSTGMETRGNFSMDTTMDKENIIRQYLKPNQISFWELPSFMRALRKMGVPTQMHLLQFLSLLFLPFVLISMTVLGIMFSQTRERRNFSFTRQFGLGVITCFIVYFIIQISSAMGSSGAISPWLAVIFPPAIVLFFAATVISKSDNM